MTETLVGLIPQYGAALMFLVTFLSCLALPVPSSLMMLAGGAFAAGGDLSLATVGLSAYGGALSGDQVGFAIGRWGQRHIDALVARYPKRAALIERARAFSERWGGPGVYFSRWLVSPLGPYVNFLAGSARMPWARFTSWDVAGEATWVTLYVGLGFLFADQIGAVADIASNLSGALAAGLVTILIGRVLFRRKKGAAHV
ncbi:MAG TPA: DedA family protein [Aliiroseovarius sp.]|nr:DedA family protein [Aliiroseovarius sp.]